VRVLLSLVLLLFIFLVHYH